MVSENDHMGGRVSSGSDRRKYPRYLVEIPLDYTDIEDGRLSTGLTANASEGGIMTFIGERVDVGTVLNLTLFFRLGFTFTAMETRSVIVWRDDLWKDYLDNYKYGLSFLKTKFSELEKLRELLRNSEPQEDLYGPPWPGIN